MNQRLQQHINFVIEIDHLKGVLRQTLLMDGSRQENSAEYSWHLALMVLTLAEYAPADVDVQRAMHQVLIHDLVEIDAGDTFCYDQAAHLTYSIIRVIPLLHSINRPVLNCFSNVMGLQGS